MLVLHTAYGVDQSFKSFYGSAASTYGLKNDNFTVYLGENGTPCLVTQLQRQSQDQVHKGWEQRCCSVSVLQYSSLNGAVENQQWQYFRSNSLPPQSAKQ